MTTHDSNQVKAHALLAQISPQFAELTADIRDVMAASNDSVLIAALLFKLAQERQQTNVMLDKLYQKYDELSFQIKTQPLAAGEAGINSTNLPTPNPIQYALLPEADQKIMDLFARQPHVDASIVQKELGYKNPNAASQRLNALVKSGQLGKIQSGKKVVFVRKN